MLDFPSVLFFNILLTHLVEKNMQRHAHNIQSVCVYIKIMKVNKINLSRFDRFH